MTGFEHFREREADAWKTFLKTGTTDDLRAWAKALRTLNDELQHRTAILQTSAPRPPAR